jgi:hypothetical protein
MAMGYQTLNNHDLIRRLRVVGLTTTTARQIVAQFQSWREASSDEWTCDHIKALKVDLIRHMGGLPPISTWIKRRKDRVTPVGPFGALWAIARSRPFTALNAINIYTTLLYQPAKGEPKLTAKQLTGFEDAVHRPAVAPEAIQAYRQLLDGMPMEWHSQPPQFQAPMLLDIPVKPYKRSPVPQRGLVPKEAVFPRALTVLSLAPAFYWKHKQLIDSALGVVKDLVPMIDPKGPMKELDVADPIPVILNKITERIARKDGIYDSPSDLVAGNVAFIQDSGYKLRHIFVTNELLQIASLPLQEFLMSELREIPQDGTYDQDAAVKRVQEYLQTGHTAHCFDLQKCSDNLPRNYQIQLFRHLGLSESWIEWFSDVTSARWELRDRIPVFRSDGKPTSLLPSSARYAYPAKHSYMRMTVGQQLGFGPSFPAFSLLHHSIIRGLARKHGRPLAYVLLGDDVVIFDDELAILYVEFMRLSGVPISSSKTIESNRIAEFAGRVILPSRVISTYKWRGRCSDNNFLDICKALGPRSLGLLRPRQRFIAEVLGWIPEPFGLGWNPHGVSYSERMKDTEELWLKLIDEKDIRVRSYQRRTSRIHRLLYEYPEWTRGLYLSSPLDQRDFSVFLEQFPFSHNILLLKLMLESWEIFLPNIDYLARSLDIGGLNGKEVSALLSRYSWIERLSKLSQLTVLERKLGLSL